MVLVINELGWIPQQPSKAAYQRPTEISPAATKECTLKRQNSLTEKSSAIRNQYYDKSFRLETSSCHVLTNKDKITKKI